MAVVCCVPYNQLLVVKEFVVSPNLNLSAKIWHGVYTLPVFDKRILVLPGFTKCGIPWIWFYLVLPGADFSQAGGSGEPRPSLQREEQGVMDSCFGFTWWGLR
jgi:hypothetical protein